METYMTAEQAWVDFWEKIRPTVWQSLTMPERNELLQANRAFLGKANYNGKRSVLGIQRLKRLLTKYSPAGRYEFEEVISVRVYTPDWSMRQALRSSLTRMVAGAFAALKQSSEAMERIRSERCFLEASTFFIIIVKIWSPIVFRTFLTHFKTKIKLAVWKRKGLNDPIVQAFLVRLIKGLAPET